VDTESSAPDLFVERPAIFKREISEAAHRADSHSPQLVARVRRDCGTGDRLDLKFRRDPNWPRRAAGEELLPRAGPPIDRVARRPSQRCSWREVEESGVGSI
jgi:hypothetical protein